MSEDTDLSLSGVESWDFGGIEIRKTSELLNQGLCMMLYGPPGSGKTTIAATARGAKTGGRVIIGDAESGAKVLAGIPELDWFNIDSWSKMLKFVANIKVKCPWNTIVFDNMSEIADLYMHLINRTLPGFKDYYQHTHGITNFIREMRTFASNTGVNIIFVAWDEPEKEESSGIIVKKLAFTPKLSARLPGFIDIIGYVSVEPDGVTRRISFAPSLKLVSKFRRSNIESAQQIPLEIYIKDINDLVMADIIDSIKGLPWPKNKYVKGR